MAKFMVNTDERTASKVLYVVISRSEEGRVVAYRGFDSHNEALRYVGAMVCEGCALEKLAGWTWEIVKYAAKTEAISVPTQREVNESIRDVAKPLACMADPFE